MQKCSNCGAANDDSAVFCVSCNHYLAWTDSPKHRPDRPRPAEPTPDGGPDPAPDAAPATEVSTPLATPGPTEPARPAGGDKTVTSQPSAGPESPDADGTAGPVESTGSTTPEVTESPPRPASVLRRVPLRQPQAQHISSSRPADVAALISAIDQGRSIAQGRQRPDLAEHLDRARQQLEGRRITCVVVGEYKRGKSTLINAVIQRAVCPVDADIVTAIPTLVRYGDQARLTSYHQPPHGEGLVAKTHSLNEITDLVSEDTRKEDGQIRSVEVRVPHRVLRSGLCLLDTPGVGGLESAHGQITMGTLSAADCLLFATDASQELTGPELEFLQGAVKRCPATALVVTKTDVFPHWRRIVELDKAHLTEAGLDLPVIPVSSFLRLRALHDPSLNEESGFIALMEFLASAVVDLGTNLAAARAAVDVDFVARQLAHETDAEQVALTKPDERPALVEQISQAQKRAVNLKSPTATWQQTLYDGIQDLNADVEHDLQKRLRGIAKDVQSLIDQGDPTEMWTETEAWLRQQVGIAAVANRDLLVTRARELSDDVAEQFQLEAGTGVELELTGLSERVQDIMLGPAAQGIPGGRLAPMLVATRISMLIPMMALGVAAHFLTFGLLLPVMGVATSLGAGVGGKLFKSEGQRQRAYRQQSAKAVASKYLDEVAFLLNKETRDALRRIQRTLRDDLQARANSLHRSTAAALEAAQRASALPMDERAPRSRRLVSESQKLQSIRASMGQFAAVGAQAAVGGGVALGAGGIASHLEGSGGDQVDLADPAPDVGEHDG
jgi:hypothetical protein